MSVAGASSRIPFHHTRTYLLLSSASQHSGIRIRFRVVRCQGPKVHIEGRAEWGLCHFAHCSACKVRKSKLVVFLRKVLALHSRTVSMRVRLAVIVIMLRQIQGPTAEAAIDGGERLRLITAPHTLPTHFSPLSPPTLGYTEHHGTHRCFTYAGGQERKSVQVSITLPVRRPCADM